MQDMDKERLISPGINDRRALYGTGQKNATESYKQLSNRETILISPQSLAVMDHARFLYIAVTGTLTGKPGR